MTRSMHVLWSLLVLTPAAVAFAQDAPRGDDGALAKSPVATANVAPTRTSAPVRDVDARLAVAEAKNVRGRAACLGKAAQRIEDAARALDRASQDEREARRQQLSQAVVAVHVCDDALGFTEMVQQPPASHIAFRDTKSSWRGCDQGDPLCSDLDVFDDDAWRQRLVREHRPMRHCFDQGLRNDVKLHGELTLSFSVSSAHPHARGLRLDNDTIDDSDVLSCVAQVVRDMRFPPRADGVRLSFTLVGKPAPSFRR